jgi:uncharacterized protein YeaO (DUF488 family)
MIELRRAYEKPSPEDGFCVLVERFWPRDLDEKHAKLDRWLRKVAPSVELHREFGDSPDAGRWERFRQLYWNELKDKHRVIKLLRQKNQEGLLTLVHAAHNPEHSAAMVLKVFLEKGDRTQEAGISAPLRPTSTHH